MGEFLSEPRKWFFSAIRIHCGNVIRACSYYSECYADCNIRQKKCSRGTYWIIINLSRLETMMIWHILSSGSHIGYRALHTYYCISYRQWEDGTNRESAQTDRLIICIPELSKCSIHWSKPNMLKSRPVSLTCLIYSWTVTESKQHLTIAVWCRTGWWKQVKLFLALGGMLYANGPSQW